MLDRLFPLPASTMVSRSMRASRESKSVPDRMWLWLQRPRSRGWPEGVVLVLLAVVGDYLTGAEVGATLFYMAAIAYATWRGSRRAGLVLSMASAALWLSVVLVTNHRRLNPAVVTWNLLLQVTLFLSFTLLLDLVRQRLDAEMRERQLAVEQLRHAERLTTVGKLASGLAHELGTPLNVISGRAELLASGLLGDEDQKRSTQLILEQTQRMSGILRQLLDFSRRGGDHKVTIDLGEVVRDAAQLLAPMAQRRRVALDIEPAPPVRVEANASELQQVVTNLLVNALHATPAEGRVRLRVSPPRSATETPLSEASFVVEDNGSGIAPEDLPHIFDPFFTTKPVGEGTGLGLSVSYGIVRDHGGHIDVDSQPGRGTRFSVFLPTR